MAPRISCAWIGPKHWLEMQGTKICQWGWYLSRETARWIEQEMQTNECACLSHNRSWSSTVLEGHSQSAQIEVWSTKSSILLALHHMGWCCMLKFLIQQPPCDVRCMKCGCMLTRASIVTLSSRLSYSWSCTWTYGNKQDALIIILALYSQLKGGTRKEWSTLPGCPSLPDEQRLSRTSLAFLQEMAPNAKQESAKAMHWRGLAWAPA